MRGTDSEESSRSAFDQIELKGHFQSASWGQSLTFHGYGSGEGERRRSQDRRFWQKFHGGPEGLSVFIAKGTKHVFKPLKQEAELYIPACLFQSSCHLDF